MLDTERAIAALGRVPLFRGLKKRQLASLAKVLVDRTYAPGEVIVPQGHDGFGFFVVISGKAEAVLERPDGERTVVNTFGPHDYFGELALLDNGPRTASVIATEETHCVVLPRQSFLSILRHDGELAVEIMIELARRFRAALEAV